MLELFLSIFICIIFICSIMGLTYIISYRSRKYIIRNAVLAVKSNDRVLIWTYRRSNPKILLLLLTLGPIGIIIIFCLWPTCKNARKICLFELNKRNYDF